VLFILEDLIFEHCLWGSLQVSAGSARSILV
jgi:hypothetical protein